MYPVGKNILFAALLLLCPLTMLDQLSAFNNPFNQKTYEKAARLLQTHNLSAADNNFFYVPKEVEAFFQTNFQGIDSLQLMWFENQKRLIKKDLGLNLTSSIGFNDRYIENEGEQSFGTRLRAGLEWNLLDEGMGKRKNDLKKLQNEQAIFFLESKLKSKERNYPYVYNNLIYAFNEEKIYWLQQRIWFLYDFIEILYELYHNHDLAYTELIDFKTKLEESKVLKKAYMRFNQALEQTMKDQVVEIDASKLPLFEINLEALLEDTTFQNLQEELATIKKKQIDLKYDASKDIRLAVATHYNYRSNVENNAYPSMGATFRIPIRFNKSERRKAINLESQMLDEDVNYVFFNNVKELMVLFQEYNSKLKQFVAFRHKVATLNERERLEEVLLKGEQTTHSPMQALMIKETQLAVQIELTDIKQQMYMRLLKMYAKTYHENFSDCLKPLDFHEVDQKLPGIRFVRIDEYDLAELRTDFLVAYLEKNEMSQVMLSISAAYDRDFVTTLQENGIRVYTEDFVPKPGSYFNKNLFDGFYTIGMDGSRRKYYIPRKYLDLQSASSLPEEVLLVPITHFSTRVEMESWIFEQAENKSSPLFLFDNIRQLIQLEKKSISMSNEN